MDRIGPGLSGGPIFPLMRDRDTRYLVEEAPFRPRIRPAIIRFRRLPGHAVRNVRKGSEFEFYSYLE